MRILSSFQWVFFWPTMIIMVLLDKNIISVSDKIVSADICPHNILSLSLEPLSDLVN